MSKVPELNLLVNDCKRLAIHLGDRNGQPSLLAVVAELELNSVKTTAGHDRRGETSLVINPSRHNLIRITQLTYGDSGSPPKG